MDHRFPRLFAAIFERLHGFAVTVYLRTQSNGDGVLLLVNHPTDTIDEARAMISRIALERAIAESPNIDFHMLDDRPLRASLH